MARKKRITEDSVFYQPKHQTKRAPVLSPSNISNFPQLGQPTVSIHIGHYGAPLAPEADRKRYNAKTGYYGYPIQDYRYLGATNPITRTLAKQRRAKKK